MNQKRYDAPEVEIVSLASVNVLTLSKWDNLEGGDFEGLE